MKSTSSEQYTGSHGYLSIFLALSLTVILSLCLTLIEGARSNGARFMTENALDIGMNSILAEYHRELLEQYDVLFVDTSYGSNLPSIGKTAQHLEYYMNRNFSSKDLQLGVFDRDLYGLAVQNLKLGNLAVATDESGKVFRKQAIQYMYDKYGLSLLTQVEEWEKVVEKYEMDSQHVTAKRESVDGEIAALDGSEVQVSEEEWVTVDVDNPSDAVNAQRNKGILLLVMRNTDDLSNVGINLNQTASHRQLYRGQGPVKEQSSAETIPELLLFDEYILEKCSRQGQELEKSHMKYQVEYILVGKENDLDNLKSIASRLLLIREAANFAYLFADDGKRAAVKALAATVSAIVLLPELELLLEYSILFAWSFAESVYDVRSLFDGGKVPLVKTAATWHTDLDSILSGGTGEDGGRSEIGLSYEDYLRVFLKMMDKDIKTMRLIDMAEFDIRKTPGNSNFRMDGCIDGMRVEANVISRYGDAFVLQRDCCYE